jgi:excisionase family DNA binding protein
MPTFESQTPSPQEMAVARIVSERLGRSVSEGRAEVRLMIDGRPLDGDSLPPAAVRLLIQGLEQIANGNAIQVLSRHTDLTSQETSELLNLSRPYVVRLLDRGEIPSHRVGSQRYVRIGDAVAFKEKLDADRREALNNLAEEAQELGMGY